MKNQLRYALFVTTLFIIFSLGCKKKADEQPTPVDGCETKYEVLYGESVTSNATATAAYESSQIKSLSSNEGKYDYTYTANQVTVSVSGVAIYRIDLSNNLASKITDLTTLLEQRLSYDGNRNLVKIEAYEKDSLTDIKTLTYSNGNLVTLSRTYPENPDVQEITTYSHSTESAGKVESETRHLFFGYIDSFIPGLLIGSTSKNRVTSSMYIYNFGTFHYESAKSYIYTGNANSTPNKIVENTHTVSIGNGIKTLDEQIKQTLLISSSCN